MINNDEKLSTQLEFLYNSSVWRLIVKVESLPGAEKQVSEAPQIL